MSDPFDQDDPTFTATHTEDGWVSSWCLSDHHSLCAPDVAFRCECRCHRPVEPGFWVEQFVLDRRAILLFMVLGFLMGAAVAGFVADVLWWSAQ